MYTYADTLVFYSILWCNIARQLSYSWYTHAVSGLWKDGPRMRKKGHQKTAHKASLRSVTPSVNVCCHQHHDHPPLLLPLQAAVLFVLPFSSGLLIEYTFAYTNNYNGLICPEWRKVTSLLQRESKRILFDWFIERERERTRRGEEEEREREQDRAWRERESVRERKREREREREREEERGMNELSRASDLNSLH